MMNIKKAYSLGQAIQYMEALEMLDMVYKVEKYIEYYDKETGRTHENVFVITYENAPIAAPEPLLYDE